MHSFIAVHFLSHDIMSLKQTLTTTIKSTFNINTHSGFLLNPHIFQEVRSAPKSKVVVVVLLTDWMTFLLPNQQVQRTQG